MTYLFLVFFLFRFRFFSSLQASGQHRKSQRKNRAHLCLVDKLYERFTFLARVLGLNITTHMTRLDTTDTLVVLGGDPIQSLYTGQRGGRHVLFSRSDKGTGSDAVVACTGECADDAETHDDGEVESVSGVPGRGYERG